MENDPVYDERTNHKMETYRENEIDIIPVYPYTLKGNYHEYIKWGIYCTVFDRLKRLEDQIGGAAVQPYRNTQYHVDRHGYR